MNEINELDVNVGIDTCHLVAKLTTAQLSDIRDEFKLHKNSSKEIPYRFVQFDMMKSHGIALMMYPTNKYTNKHYNCCLQLQSHLMQADYIPQSIQDLIHNFDWNIKRIDIAFDTSTTVETSMIYNHHANKQFDKSSNYGLSDDWNTEYLGKFTAKSTSKVAHYDRNVKAANRNINIEYIHNNRFEVRLFAKCNDETMKLHSMKDDFILAELQKYIFIADIEQLPLGKVEKNRLYRLKADWNYHKTLNRQQKERLKSVCKARRLPLEQLYINNKHNLFAFIMKQESLYRSIAI